MFKLSIKCPRCGNELQKWDPSLAKVKCNNCHSVFFAQNGVFHLYSGAEKNKNVEIHDRMSGFAVVDESTNLTNLQRIIPKLFFKQISNTKSKKVFLDAGCGYGDLSIAACEFFDEVIAIDAGDHELEYLAVRIKNKDIKNIYVFKSSLMNLPFTAEQFSGIGCIQVLEHVRDAKKALKNLYSNLSPGGLLYLSTPNKYSIKPEAHTKLLGIGYLPKIIGLVYAQLFGKYDEYKSVSLVSINKLKKLFYPYFGQNIKFIRSGFHQSFLGKLAKWSWEKPLLKHLAYFLVADIEVVAYKK